MHDVHFQANFTVRNGRTLAYILLGLGVLMTCGGFGLYFQQHMNIMSVSIEVKEGLFKKIYLDSSQRLLIIDSKHILHHVLYIYA